MAPKSQFAALQREHGDESLSVEMLSMRSPSHDALRGHSFESKEDAPERRNKGNKTSFWRYFSPWSHLHQHGQRRFPRKIFFVISALPLALIPIVVLATAAEVASTTYILGRDCYPNGLWQQATGATWRIMDSSYFFTPNLSFGAMTFTQVKVIDIAWDLIIGRGGQMLLAWVNYRVFNEWLLYHMEMHMTSYKMYTAVAFETTSIKTLGVLGKEFLAYGENSWKRFFRWVAMLCMLISTFYVLAFPTLMAAMTGYITTYGAYVEDHDHNLIEWDRVAPVRYIIHDSSRIGNYSKPLVVIDQSWNQELIDSIRNYSHTYNYPENYVHTPEDLPISISHHTNNATTFVFNSTTIALDVPGLNITWSGNANKGKLLPGIHRPFYTLSNSTQGDFYSAEYILNHGSCQPSETYQWGFSYIFLFMVSIFNFVWSCIMVGMWIDTLRGSRMYKSGRRPGLLKSVMDISGAIREELGESVERLEEEELRRALRDSGGALVVPKKELKVARTDTGGRERKWRRRVTKGSTF